MKTVSHATYHIRKQTIDKVLGQVRGQVCLQAGDQVGGEVRGRIENHLLDQVLGLIWSQVWGLTRSQFADQIYRKAYHEAFWDRALSKLHNEKSFSLNRKTVVHFPSIRSIRINLPQLAAHMRGLSFSV